MKQSLRSYPELDSFLSGWFHQDFDIEGDTIESIVHAFNSNSSQEERSLLAIDINAFLKNSGDRVDEEFVRIFNPEIDPMGFAPTTRAFLEMVLMHLSRPI